MFIRLLVLTLFVSSVWASEPTPEQFAVMKEFGLTVPPVLLDEQGHNKNRLIDIANDAKPIAAAKTPRAIILDASAPVEVSITSDGKHYDVTFEQWVGPLLPKINPDITSVTLINGADVVPLLEKSKVVVVDVFADWCQPCRNMAPAIEAAAKEMKDTKFYKVEFDEAVGFRTKYGVYAIPCLIVFSDGKQIGLISGSGETKDSIKEHIQYIRANPMASAVVRQPTYESVPAQYEPEQPARRQCGHSWGSR